MYVSVYAIMFKFPQFCMYVRHECMGVCMSNSDIEFRILLIRTQLPDQISLCENDLKVGLVTFGMPRTLSDHPSTLDKLTYPHLRVVNYGDPVPSLPPSVLGFTHSATKVVHFVKVRTP